MFAKNFTVDKILKGKILFCQNHKSFQAISLQGADDLVLLDIYPAREKPIEGVDSKMLLDLCNNNRKELCKKEELLTVLKYKEIDILLTLGAGVIGSLAQPIKHMLN